MMSGTERASGGGAITLRLCYAMAGTEPAYVFAPGKQQHYIPENLLGNHTVPFPYRPMPSLRVVRY